ncbi:MAG: hypothetical protein ACREJ2_07955 [Planctomycetota bacterium]
MRANRWSVVLLLSLLATGCALHAADASALAQAATPPEPLTDIHLANDRTIDCTSDAAILKGLLKDGMTPQQEAITLWRFTIQRNMHKEMSRMSDNQNMAELMTKTGYGICGNWGPHVAQLAADAGLTASSVYLNGHVVAAVNYWGDWHMIDTDMWAMYAKANGVLGSPHDIKSLKNPDGSWELRMSPPIKSFPWYQGSDTLKGMCECYAQASVNQPFGKLKPRWTYNLSLRPGEAITFSWYPDPDVGSLSLDHLPNEDCGRKLHYKSLRDYLESDYDYYQRKDHAKAKWSWGARRGGLRPNPLQDWPGVEGTGRVTFDLGRSGGEFALSQMSAQDNLTFKNGKLALADGTKAGSFTLDFADPYCYADGWIVKAGLPAKGLNIDCIVDGKSEPVYADGAAAGKAADDGPRIRLFDLVRGVSAFQLKFTLAPGSDPIAPPTAIGAFVLCYNALPGLVKGKNQIQLAGGKQAGSLGFQCIATYVYDQVNDKHELEHTETRVAFPDDGSAMTVDTGDKHWPLMREIRLDCTRALATSAVQAPVTDTLRQVDLKDASYELDWAAVQPWNWAYWGVNFWNDFERGDRQGWMGQLSTENTYNGSDFCLKDNLMTADGHRQLKFIRFGAFLNHHTHFKCMVFVKNVKSIECYTRDQNNGNYYTTTFTDLKDGQWQPIEVTFTGLKTGKDNSTIQENDFLDNVYLHATPADGKTDADVEYRLDNTICYDGDLKFDPFTDPDAPQKAAQDDPVWTCKGPQQQTQAN